MAKNRHCTRKEPPPPPLKARKRGRWNKSRNGMNKWVRNTSITHANDLCPPSPLPILHASVHVSPHPLSIRKEYPVGQALLPQERPRSARRGSPYFPIHTNKRQHTATPITKKKKNIQTGLTHITLSSAPAPAIAAAAITAVRRAPVDRRITRVR
jgi:hypothetical protein